MEPPKNHTQDVIWRAKYDDGTELLEVDSHGVRNQFKNIDQTKLQIFEIIPIPKEADDFIREEVSLTTKNLAGDNIRITVSTFNQDIKPILSVSITEGKRLIFVRRQTKTTGQHMAIFGDDPNAYAKNEDIPKCEKCNNFTTITKLPYPLQHPSRTVIIIGWQQEVNGKNVQAINYLFPDGSVELAGEWGSDSVHKKVNPYIPE